MRGLKLTLILALLISRSLAAVTPTPGAVPHLGVCTADCGDDDTVTADEIILAINLALGLQPIAACPAADPTHDGRVTVDEIIEALDAALRGCFMPTDLYEPDDSKAFAKPIHCGETQTHALAAGGDSDVVRFQLSELTGIRVSVDGLDFHPFLSLHGDPNLVQHNDDEASDIVRTCGFNALSPGPYYFSISTYAVDPDYSMRLECTRCTVPNPSATPTPTGTVTPTPDSFEPDGSPQQARDIECGRVQTHSIQPASDNDWFRLELPIRSQVELRTNGRLSGDTRMRLFNHQMELIDADDDGGDRGYSYISRSCPQSPLESGEYYIWISSFEGTIESYDLSVSCLSCLPPTPTSTATPIPTATAEPIRCGESSRHSFDGEFGPFPLQLTVPELSAVSVRLFTSETILKWTLLGENGVVDSGEGQPHPFACGQNALAAGDYRIEIRSAAERFGVAVACEPCGMVANPTGTPTRTPTPTAGTLAADSFEPDDVPASAKPIECGEVQHHTLAGEDTDRVRITLPAFHALQFDVDATAYLRMSARGPEGLIPFFDRSLPLVDCDRSRPVDQVYDFVLRKQLLGDPDVDYRLAFQCLPCAGEHPTPTPPPAGGDSYEPDNDTYTARALECGTLQFHTLDIPEDEDWLRVELPQRTAVWIHLSEGQPNYDPEVTLFDAQGSRQEDSLSGADLHQTCALGGFPAGSYSVRVAATDSPVDPNDPNSPDELQGGLSREGPIAYSISMSCLPCEREPPTPSPTPTFFPTPTPLPADSFEPDDLVEQASTIECNQMQSHTLGNGDVDWLTFVIDAPSSILIETCPWRSSCPLRMDLFRDSTKLATDVENGLITLPCTPPGAYQLMLREDLGDSTTRGYQASLFCIPCGAR